MSLGQIIGGIVGAVVGFYLGGPMGALYGLSLGAGLGGWVDPNTPDIPTPGVPNPEKSVTLSTIGNPCKDLLGTAKISGHLIMFGGERSVAVYADSGGGGGKGGGDAPPAQQTGFDYYATWALGFCIGPVDTLYTVFKNEDIIYEGPIDRPASGGEETITLDGMGTMTFYFGTDDHLPNANIGLLMDDDTINTPYRNYCWAVFNDCMIGGYPRIPTISILVRKAPEFSFSGKEVVSTFDYNPSHALWYILHELAGMPESFLDEIDFAAVAKTLKTDAKGISILFGDQKEAVQYLQTINNHIDNILRYGTDGKFHPKLIRDDYDIDDLPEVDESLLLEEPSLTRKTWVNTVNEIKVQFSQMIDVERDNREYGELYVTGNNSTYYPMYDSGSTYVTSFLQIGNVFGNNQKVHKVNGNKSTAYVFLDDGTLWTRGRNDYGHCGRGSSASWLGWGQVGAAGEWDEIKTQEQNQLWRKTTGALYATGQNPIHYYIPDYPTSYGSSEMRIPIRLDDNIYASAFGIGWGGNMWLVDGNVSKENPNLSPPIWSTFVGAGSNSYHSMGMPTFGGTLYRVWMGIEFPAGQALDIKGGNAFTYISVGTADNFELWAAGINTNGQCGVPTDGDNTIEDWILVPGGPWKCFDVGSGHVVAIKTDGTAWATGDSQYGKTGQGDSVNRWGFDQIGVADNWEICSCGAIHSMFINSDGELWGCGYGRYGELGTGDRVSTNVNLRQEASYSEWIGVTCLSNCTWALKA